MKKIIWVSMLLGLFGVNCHADNANLNETIVRIINQINAINPLIDEAKQAQSKNARIKLHLDSFVGSDNKTHSGLRQDLNAIKKSLVAYLNKPSIEPKKIEPLALDYIDAPSGDKRYG